MQSYVLVNGVCQTDYLKDTIWDEKTTDMGNYATKSEKFLPTEFTSS
jgi:hypothetical protein